ncbi:MAG TPA: SirB2 family protein [Burkholderiales bacterium]|nr:SirB2 family protein [Burkholderiales bacterium]
MNAYFAVKAVHVGAVALSLAGFAGRGALMLADSPLLRVRWVRIVPHLVDTVLLASALWLCWIIRQYPFQAGWLTAKVLGLIAYIALGTVALRRGKTKAARSVAYILALLAAAYVVSVALAHDPAGPLAWLR